MTDYSVFSDSSFDSIQWINALLEETGDGNESLESRLGGVQMKLHIMAQDYTDQLETAMVESMSTMPRVLSEITRNEEQLRTVQQEMKLLSEQLTILDQRNIAGVEDLSRLDALKSSMEKCKSTLEEHARWSQLVRETKNLLESGGRLADSADKIETMSNSLSVLKNLPGSEERQAAYDSFKNSLLSALRPIVRRDVSGMDLGPLKEYLYVFTKLGRREELAEEYVLCRPEQLKSKWDEYDFSRHGKDLSQWLTDYLRQAVRLISEEEENVRELFGSQGAPEVLINLLMEALQPMNAGLKQRLMVLKNPLVSFGAYCALDEFSARIARFMVGGSEDKQREAMVATFGTIIDYSKSTYVDEETCFIRQQLLNCIESIFFSTVSGGATDGKGDIEEELFGDDAESSNAYAVYSERLLQAMESFTVPIEASLQRAVRIVGGTQVKGVLRALSAALVLFVRHLVAKVDDLTVACGFPRESGGLSTTLTSSTGTGLYDIAGKGSSNITSTTAAGAEISTIATAASTQLRSSEVESISDINSAVGESLLQQQAGVAQQLASCLDSCETDSRVLITCALRSLQAVGRFIRNFNNLERRTKQRLIEVQSMLFNNPLFILPVGASTAVGTTPVSLITMNSIKAATSETDNKGQVYSIGTAFMAHLLDQDELVQSELKGYLLASSASSQHLSQSVFAAVAVPLQKLRHSVGTLLFRLCVEAPEKMVSILSTEECWSFSPTGEAEIPSFEALKDNMLPQSIVTQVGEHLLSLVQELEAFASSDALRDLLVVSGDVNELSMQSSGWQELKSQLEIQDGGLESLFCRSKCTHVVASIETMMFGASDAALSLATEGDSGGTGTLLDDQEDEELSSASVLRFVNEWLAAIADAIVGLLIAQICSIPLLTRNGCAQLVIDIEYLGNVIQAMGVQAHPLLLHVKFLMEQTPQALIKCIDLIAAGKAKGATGHLLSLDHRLIEAVGKGHGLL